MSDFNAMEILTHDEFWGRDPAPDTLFFELGGRPLKLVGRLIDPETEDSTNAVMVQVGQSRPGDSDELYAVVKWGDWTTEANQKVRRLRIEAERLIDIEE